MSSYSFVELIKLSAKKYAKMQSITLSAAQNQIALNAGFVSYHDLVTVSKRNPVDRRLMIAALGVSSLADAIYENDVFSSFESELEDRMSGETAVTNAYDYTVEDLVVESSSYDESSGILSLNISFSYSGDQDPDRVWHGSIFYLDVTVSLIRRDCKWLLAEEGLIILSGESDQDRDYSDQQDYLSHMAVKDGN